MIHVFTHDSIGLGEDGPTHQPVEQLASLRAMPGLIVLRPCRRQRGRRGLAGRDAAPPRAGGAGADAPGRADPRPLEVRLRRGPAPRRLRAGRSRRRRPRGDPDRDRQRGPARDRRLRGARRRRASAPGSSASPPGSCSTASPPNTASRCSRPAIAARVAVEQGSTFGWERYVGQRGAVVGMHTFGASAPLKEVERKFGFTPERVAEVAGASSRRDLARRCRRGARATRRTRMTQTARLHDLGQSLWLDNITRTMLDDGTLDGYIDELSVTGLTSNPTIFDKAIVGRRRLRRADRRARRPGIERRGRSSSSSRSPTCAGGRPLQPVHERTDGVDGWVSLEVSPLLAYDADATIQQAADAARRGRPRQPLHQDPGHRGRATGDRGDDLRRHAGQRHAAVLGRAVRRRRRGLHARDRAPHRGRAEPGGAARSPRCSSAAGTSPSTTTAPAELRDQLGIAVARRTYRAYRELLDSDRWLRLANEGARPQRLLWASTGTKDPEASDVLYIEALASPFTVNTMPENTLLAFADHGEVGDPMPADGGDAEDALTRSPRPASTSTRSPRGCRTRAPTRSSSPGTSCSTRSRRETPRGSRA